MKIKSSRQITVKFWIGMSCFCLGLAVVVLPLAVAKNDKKIDWTTAPDQNKKQKEEIKPKPININPSHFKKQNDDEFILDTQKDKFELGLPAPPDNKKGTDLSKYDLEFSFKNADGKHIQLWYKDSKWKSVYSWEFKITGKKSIRFNPSGRGTRNVNEFTDFTHIYAIGAKVREGIGEIKIISVKLIKRD
jgi:hypothetical protein